MRSPLHIVALLFAVGCSTPTAIDLSVVTNPTLTDRQALLSQLERMELVLDSDEGLYALSSVRDLGALRIEDVDSDGSAELISEFEMGSKLPLIRLERGGLDPYVTLMVKLRGYGADNLHLASGELRNVFFSEGNVDRRLLEFNYLPAFQAPRVKQTVPHNGAEASVTESVHIIFTTKMDSTTVGQQGVVQVLRVTPAGAEEPLAASQLSILDQASPTGDFTTVTFVPTEPLLQGTYRIRVSTAARAHGAPHHALDQIPGEPGEQDFVAQFVVPMGAELVAAPALDPMGQECGMGGTDCPPGLSCDTELGACLPEVCECPDPALICDPVWMTCMPDCRLTGSDACPPEWSCDSEGLCVPPPPPTP